MKGAARRNGSQSLYRQGTSHSSKEFILFQQENTFPRHLDTYKFPGWLMGSFSVIIPHFNKLFRMVSNHLTRILNYE